VSPAFRLRANRILRRYRSCVRNNRSYLRAEEKGERRRVTGTEVKTRGKKERTMETVLLKEETEGQRARERERERGRGDRAGVKSQKKRSREITLSPTRMRGSYESRGGRNLDYCSPDYNITRTDRSACVTGDQIKTVLRGVFYETTSSPVKLISRS